VKVKGVSTFQMRDVVHHLNRGDVEEWLGEVVSSPNAPIWRRYEQWVERYGRFNNYQLNLKFGEIEDRSSTRTTYTHFTLRVADSHGVGARWSASGRHGPWACWHAFRDVIALTYIRWGSAGSGITWWTGMARYLGWNNFWMTFPATGDRNIGSVFSPTTMPECCECAGYEYGEEEDLHHPDFHMDPVGSTVRVFSQAMMEATYTMGTAEYGSLQEVGDEPNHDAHTFVYGGDDEITAWKELVADMERVKRERKGWTR